MRALISCVLLGSLCLGLAGCYSRVSRGATMGGVGGAAVGAGAGALIADSAGSSVATGAGVGAGVGAAAGVVAGALIADHNLNKEIEANDAQILSNQVTITQQQRDLDEVRRGQFDNQTGVVLPIEDREYRYKGRTLGNPFR